MNVDLLSLKIAAPHSRVNVANDRLTCWPPNDDFPIAVSSEGRIVSRYRDSKWDLSAYATRRITLNFGDGRRGTSVSPISRGNALLLRQIVAWWMYGNRNLIKPLSLKADFSHIRPLFVLCSENDITASDLSRYPKVADQLVTRIPHGNANRAFRLLEELYGVGEELGFLLLDKEGLRRLEAALPSHVSRQTPYIPPRIWQYQIHRLQAFLDDFHAHSEAIEACYNFCLDAYAKNFGSLTHACGAGRDSSLSPFNGASNRHKVLRLGAFSDIARRFGIADLLARWSLPPGTALNRDHNITLFGKYFTQVGFVGTAYLLNFSGMRIAEALSLRTDCLEVEHDQRFGAIHLLRGQTTKTIDDDDALWVTSPSAKSAVQAMACVARMRMVAATASPLVPTTLEDCGNPYLVLRAYEPWASLKLAQAQLSVRPSTFFYHKWPYVVPNLFDPTELRLTQDDLDFACLINPTLDRNRFKIGREWPLAWHQLRRTLAVNMASSGLVSDASIQVQFKHASRAMSLYYMQGYTRRRLNQSVRDEHIRSVYEMLGEKMARLFSDHHVSPLGTAHKANILKAIDPAEHRYLRVKAKQGLIAYRETLLGSCLQREPCPYGGIDNVAHCGGGIDGSPCPSALFDRTKRAAIEALDRAIASRLTEAPPGTPLRSSLQAQQRSVENALYAINSQ